MSTGEIPDGPDQGKDTACTPDAMPAAAAAPPDVVARTLDADDTYTGVLAKVQRISTWLGPWHKAVLAVHDRAIAAAGSTAKLADGGEGEATNALEAVITAADSLASMWCPSAAAYWLISDDNCASAVRSVGPHVELLSIALLNADAAWPHAKSANHPAGGTAKWPQASGTCAAAALTAQHSLEEASRHVALLLLVERSRTARVGERIDVAAALDEWDLPAEDATTLLAWVVQDPPRFDGQLVPLVVDKASSSLYRTASGIWEKVYTTTAALWGTILALGIIVLVFMLLASAQVTTWPKDWFSRMAVLYLCVVVGAAAHVASKALANINFDDPLKIYAASGGLDWLRLRWLSILCLLIPIMVVTGSLWGAGNIPTRFQDIGVALLSGYSADSLFRNSISRLSSASSK